MRLSEFWRLAHEEFGRAYAETLTRDLVLATLDRTAAEALAEGVPAREVWEHLCDAMQVPPARRWGRGPVARSARGPRA